MAKIVSSEAAPSEAVHYTFGGVEFDLGGSGKKTFETDDVAVLREAESHPWLSVDWPKVDVVQGVYVEQVDPKDDPLSWVNNVGNDPEAAQAAEDAKVADDAAPVAVEAGLTQTKVVTTDGVAETLAADPTSKTSDKKGKN